MRSSHKMTPATTIHMHPTYVTTNPKLLSTNSAAYRAMSSPLVVAYAVAPALSMPQLRYMTPGATASMAAFPAVAATTSARVDTTAQAAARSAFFLPAKFSFFFVNQIGPYLMNQYSEEIAARYSSDIMTHIRFMSVTLTVVLKLQLVSMMMNGNISLRIVILVM